MQKLAPMIALFLLAVAAPTAAAHRSYNDCPSQTVIVGTPHVDTYGGDGCFGATIASGGQCSLDNEFGEKYVFVLLAYGQACQTGVIVFAPGGLP